MQNKIFLTTSLGILIASLLLVPQFSFAGTIGPCEPRIYFDITKTNGEGGVRTIPWNESVILYTQLTPSPGCVRKGVEVISFNQTGPTGEIIFLKTILDPDIVFANATTPEEYKYTQGVSGFTDKTSGGPVQPNGSVSVRVGIKLEGETEYRFSSPISFTVTAAADAPPPGTGGPGGGGEVVGKITSPIGISNVGEFVVTVIQYLLGLVAALAVLFIIIGGVRMVASGGAEGNITAGKKTVTWAVVGLVVSLLAFTIVNIVQNLLKVK